MLRQIIQGVLIVFFITQVTACVRKNPPVGVFNGVSCGKVEYIGCIDNESIAEISGIASSRINRDILWVVNDSGNAPELFAVTMDGAVAGTFRVSGVENRDWEDLASFRYRGISYLLIADVGDNKARHDTCSLLVLREPVIGNGQDVSGSRDVTPVGVIRFRYEDGPRDCEAVAVDTVGNRIMLLSKRTRPPVLYKLPLMLPGSDTVLTAERTGEVTTIPAPNEKDLLYRYGRFLSYPTAMDLSTDGTALVILTYKHAYLYERQIHESWKHVLTAPPRRVRLPHPETGVLIQREAVCFGNGNRNLFVTSEKSPAPLYRLAP